MLSLLDLVVPATCAGCGRAGAVVCEACLAPLRSAARLRWPTPVPHGLPPPYAVAAYAGSTRRLVVAYKDRDSVGLATRLAPALRASILAARAAAPRGTLLVVPVPSSRGARRRRGYEPVLDLTRRALRGAPGTAGLRLAPVLGHARAVRDSAGLGAAERAANLHGALQALPGAAAHSGTAAVVVDDVVTTGATLAEAARALRQAGIPVVAAAVVAATARRHQ